MQHEIKKQIRRDCMRYMKQVTVTSFCADFLMIAMPTVNAYMIGNMTDYLIALDMPGILYSLPSFLVAILLTVLAAPLFTMWKYVQMSKNGFGYDSYIVNRFLHKPLREIQQSDFGTVIERVEGDLGDFCWNTVLLYSLPLVIAGYAVLIGWTMIHSESPVLFAAALTVLPPLPVIKAQLWGQKKAMLRREFAEYNEKRRGVEADIIPSLDFLQNYQMDTLMKKLLRTYYDRYMEMSGKKKQAFESQNTALDFLLEHGIPLCVLTVGALLVSRNALTVGALLSGYLMLPAISKCYAYGVSFVEELRGAHEYIDRLSMFYGEQEEETVEEKSDIKALCAEGLSFAYDKTSGPVFDDFSMSAKVGECAQIVGPNGCGKSTLIFMLSGLYAPDKGMIKDQGGNQLSLKQLRSAVALQEQDGAIFSGTIQNNLFIHRENVDRAQELLGAFGMEKPLDYQVETNGKNLSPGEQKKLLLIRMLLKPAQFYILDEPLNHLDQKGKQALIEQIEKSESGFIIISHQDFLPHVCNIISI